MKIVAAAESPFRRALVPLDGSRIAEAVLPMFLPMARPLQIEVALVRVVVPTIESAADESPEAFEAAQRAKEHKRQEAIDYLRVVAAMPLFEGLSVTTSVRAGQAPDQGHARPRGDGMGGGHGQGEHRLPRVRPPQHRVRHPSLSSGR